MTRPRRRREYESHHDMLPFLRRMARAMVRRADDGDLDALVVLVEVRAAVDEAIRDAARGLYDDGNGYSWTQIGQELGVSKQAAQKRFADNPALSPKPRTGRK